LILTLISPYLFERKWYDEKKKKPHVQLRILEEIVRSGTMSKSKVRSVLKKNYKDISTCIDNLNDKKLIEISGVLLGRGKPEKNYKITEDGMAALIIEDTTPHKFWSLVTNFCYHDENLATIEMVDSFYQLFIKRYYRYPAGQSATLQLRSLNRMCRKWIQQNVKNGTIGIDQKIIEILAIHPDSTIEDLALKTKQSRERIMECLSNYSMTSSDYSGFYAIDYGDLSSVMHERYLDFIQHSIILAKQNVTRSFRLSLFGIVFAMTIIRKFSRFYSFPIYDYYDKIIASYKDQKLLPLIFGKWDMLKSKLDVSSCYNFDIIVDEEARSTALSLSVLLGGLKEYYESMCSIVTYCASQLNNILSVGVSELSKYETDNKKTSYSAKQKDNSQKAKKVLKTTAVSQKLDEIYSLAKYSNPLKFQSDLYEEELEKSANRSSLSTVKILSDALAEEISFLYYLNLLRDYQVPLIYPYYGSDRVFSGLRSKMLKMKTIHGSRHGDLHSLLSPRKKFKEIIDDDEDIKIWLNIWKRDLIKFQKDLAQAMSLM
jgi:DNA-binding PadR family transcriptional regulator